tara:strand:- start:72 stop:509 length:438 start_codon:yes stop_codon:yes gene_type:complete
MMKINKAFKNVLSAGVLTIFIIIGGGSLDTDEGAEKIAVSTPDYVLTADTLFNAYDKNSVAADAKYEDKIVKVSGTVQSIGKDIMDTAYLVIGGSGFLDGVQCMLPRGQEGLVARVSKGQYVTLKGKVSGQIMGNVIVNNCSFSN